MIDLSGKGAVITGGARGIGRAIALRFAEQGADVVFSYRGNSEAAQQTVADIEALGRKALAVQADVVQPESAKVLIEAGLAELGRIDILVNNAGITRDNLLMRLSEEDFDSVLRTNLKGTFLLTKAVSRPMMKQRTGRIVNLSSVVGQMGNAGQSNYSAAKAGIIGFTKSMARELASRGVTVNAIAPGFIMTAMTAALPENVRQGFLDQIPMGKFGTPEDVAELAVYLASDGASYVTGQVIGINGGLYM
jgi:3-oxoacyl-[acyl-carrier protein] reductase